MPRDDDDGRSASALIQSDGDAPLSAAFSSLVHMISSEVANEMQADEAIDATSSNDPGVPVIDVVVSRVMRRAQDWPRTHAQFHKLDAINCAAEEDVGTEAEMATMLHRLERLQQPPSPSSVAAAAAAAAASSASTVAAAASSAVVARSHSHSHSAYVSSISSTAGFHSLFSSAALPSYDSLLECCLALSYHPLMGAPSHLSLLLSALEMPLGDILASPQWNVVLQSLAGCAVWGRRCPPSPAIAGAVAANAAAASTSAASPSPPGRAASRKKAQSNSSNHTSHSHKKPGAAASSKSKPTQPAIPVPVSAPSPDVPEQFQLACTALRALQGLYEAAEGSVQTAEIYLALLGVLKATFLHNHNHNRVAGEDDAGAGGAISFLSVLPTSAAEILPLPPSLFLPSLWFHAARLWSHMAHSVLDLSPHFSDEVLAEVVARTGEIVGIFLAATSASSSAASSSNSLSNSIHSGGNNSSLFWTLFGMQDPRAIWLRKWVSQFAIRTLWHRPPVAASAVAGNATKKGEQYHSPSLPRAVAAALRSCKEYAAHLALNPFVPSSSPPAAATPGVLTLSASECHALAHTAAFGFLFEHLTSWLPPLPVIPAPVVAPVAAAAVTVAAKGASRGKKAAASSPAATSSTKQSLGTAATAALPVVSCAVADAEQAHADSMRALRELASHMLLDAALHFAPTAPTTATDAAVSPSASPPLLERTRLTLLSCCHRFLAHTGTSSDGLDSAEAITKEAAWVQWLLQRSFHALICGAAALLEAHASSKEYFSKLSQSLAASSTVAAAVASSPTANGSSGKKGFGAAGPGQQQNRAAGKKLAANGGAASTDSGSPAKAGATVSDDPSKRRSTQPAGPSSDLGGSAGPTMTLVQQAALTAILGLALGFAQQSTVHRAALVDGAKFPSLPAPVASPTNSDATEATVSLQHFLCQLLGFDDTLSASAAAASAAGNTRRRIKFFDGVGSAAASSAVSSDCIIALPSALESMMVDLLRLCIVPTPSSASTSASGLTEQNSELQFRCMRGLAARIERLVVSLPPSLWESASDTAAVSSNDQDATTAASIAHQHSPCITMLLDLLSHWACALPAGWDQLHASHSRLVDLCARRFVASLRTQQSNAPCLAWCARCFASTPSAVATSPSAPDSFLTIQACSRALRRMVQSGPTFRALVQQGLVHDLLSRLAGRLREEEEGGRWGLAFELASESASAADGSDQRQQNSEEEELWSLRMLIQALGHSHARALMDEEVQLLLHPSPHVAGATFLTAPRPPLFLMLSSLVRSWVAQEDFIDDEASAAAASNVDTAAADVGRLSLNGSSSGGSGPMKLPLTFSSLSPPSFAGAPSCQSSWSVGLSLFSCVASSANALEVGLRLLCGLVRCEPAFAQCMDRWWNLGGIVRPSYSSDGVEIEDQSSRWRRKLLAAIASAGK